MGQEKSTPGHYCVMNVYMVRIWEKEADGLCAGERGGSEEVKVARSGLMWVTLSPAARAVAEGHVLVCGPDAAAVVCVNAQGSCYRGPCRGLESGTTCYYVSV